MTQLSSRRGASHASGKRSGKAGQRNHSGRGRDGSRGGQPKQTRAAVTQETSATDIPRFIAWQVMQAVIEDAAYANLTLPGLIDSAKLSQRDAGFATELCYGTLRQQGLLDRIIAQVSSRNLADIETGALNVLRLGTYQLLCMRVQAHAAIDTSVNLGRHAIGHHVCGFINGILRSVSAKDFAQWKAILAAGETSGLSKLAVTTAHPRWIVNAFGAALGTDAATLPQLLASNDARPALHLAVVPSEITAEELALIAGGEEGNLSPYAVHLPAGAGSPATYINDGLARVQDEGSQLVALAATKVAVDGPDDSWLDLCAGPGGKAALLGSLARFSGAQLTAVEVSEHRAELVRSAVKGLPVTVETADGRDYGTANSFDRVLVDAPCSGLGALRRRPEARWRKQESDIAQLAALQQELLASALRLVRPGGVVLYATCSPHLQETFSIVNAAVKPGVELVDLWPLFPQMERKGEDKAIQLWPHIHGTDAMFMCALRKTA